MLEQSEVEALIGHLMSYGIGTRPSKSYRRAPTHLIGARPPILSARAHPSYRRAPICLVSTRPSTRSTTVCKLRSPIPSSRAASYLRDATVRPYLGSPYAYLCSWPCYTVLAAGDRSPALPQKRAKAAKIYFVVVATANALRARESSSASSA
jgi:hypothetical protein